MNSTIFNKTLCFIIFLFTASILKSETVTYTIVSKNKIEKSGVSPEGSSAKLVETYTQGSKQMTAGNSQTLTLEGFEGCIFSSVTVSMKSNSSKGAGNFYYFLNDESHEIVPTQKFNHTSWNGSWSTNYVNVTKQLYMTGAKTTEFMIAATENSLYCESYSFTYTKSGGPGLIRKPVIKTESGTYYEDLEVTIGAYGADTTLYYTLDGEDPTIRSLVYDGPFYISSSAKLRVIAVADIDKNKSGEVSADYILPVKVSNIAEFLSSETATSTTLYKITGSVAVTHFDDDVVFIKDATGFSRLSLGNYDSYYSNGDILSNICGTFYKSSNKTACMMVLNTPNLTKGEAVEPELITGKPEITDDSKYIRIESITFPEDVIEWSENYHTSYLNLPDGNKIKIRNYFNLDSNYSKLKKYNVLGILSYENPNIILFPISIDEIISTDPKIEISLTDDQILDFGEIVNHEISELTFDIYGVNLSNDITIESNIPSFNITPAIISPIDGKVEQMPIKVTYAPAELGNHTAEITIRSGEDVAPIIINASGKSIKPILNAPEVYKATDVSLSGFRANWDYINDATHYEVNVWREHVLYNEDFSSINSGNSTSTSGSSTPWSDNCSNIVERKEVYKAGGAIRVGSGTKEGYIITKGIDLSDFNGEFKVSFDVKGWTTVVSDIIVSCGDESHIVEYNAIMDEDFENKSVTFSCGTTNSEIKISTAKRAFLDNIVITQGNSLAGSPFATTENYYDVADLNEGTPYKYSVTAKADTHRDSKESRYIYVNTIALPRFKMTAKVSDFDKINSVSVNGKKEVDLKEDEEACFTAIPAEGYKFRYWRTEEFVEVSDENPYIIKNHDRDITLVGVFDEIDDPNGVNDVLILKPYISDGYLMVPAQAGQLIEIFNVLGQKIKEITAKDDLSSIKLQENRIYIVKVGNETVKVNM